MNSTYSIHEFDQNFERPRAIENLSEIKNISFIESALHERTKTPISKQSFCSTEHITPKNAQSRELLTKLFASPSIETKYLDKKSSDLEMVNLPKIIVSDWDSSHNSSSIGYSSNANNHQDTPATFKYNLLQEEKKDVNNMNIFKNNVLVQEISIDHFHYQDSPGFTNQISRLNNENEKQKNSSNTIFQTANNTNSILSCESVCKIARPACIEIELFDCFEDQKPPDVNDSDLKIKDKKYLTISENENIIYENDEYNFKNIRDNEEETKNNDIKKGESKFKIMVGNLISKQKMCEENKYLNFEHCNKPKESKAITECDYLLLDQVIDGKLETRTFENYYLYVNWEKCRDIFTKRCIDLECFIHNGKIMNGIIFLTLLPDSDDTVLLNELYGSNTPIDQSRVQCFIKFKRDLLDKNTKNLIQLDKFKFAFTKRIQFGVKFPKHEFRSKYNFGPFL